MALAQEDIEQIQRLIQSTLRATPELNYANVRYELDLHERTIRIEDLAITSLHTRTQQ